MKVVNLTIELSTDEEVYTFEKWLEMYVKIRNLTIIPDTKELYEKDDNFKRITKKYYEAKKIRDNYINEKNYGK